jgi:hypothetical protein
MSEISFNNVHLDYKGSTISIAQHRNQRGDTLVQEIYVIDGDHDPLWFDGTSQSLIETLGEIMEYLDKENQSNPPVGYQYSLPFGNGSVS